MSKKIEIESGRVLVAKYRFHEDISLYHHVIKIVLVTFVNVVHKILEFYEVVFRFCNCVDRVLSSIVRLKVPFPIVPSNYIIEQHIKAFKENTSISEMFQ